MSGLSRYLDAYSAKPVKYKLVSGPVDEHAKSFLILSADGLNDLLKTIQQRHGLAKDLALSFSEDADGVSLTITATPIALSE